MPRNAGGKARRSIRTIFCAERFQPSAPPAPSKLVQERSLRTEATLLRPGTTLTALSRTDPADDVALAAGGDVRAFERLYRAHLPKVHSLVRRMAAGRDTDELTQDV